MFKCNFIVFLFKYEPNGDIKILVAKVTKTKIKLYSAKTFGPRNRATKKAGNILKIIGVNLNNNFALKLILNMFYEFSGIATPNFIVWYVFRNDTAGCNYRTTSYMHPL